VRCDVCSNTDCASSGLERSDRRYDDFDLVVEQLLSDCCVLVMAS
jgi:hypothetical protein